jgi:hypothetical protein
MADAETPAAEAKPEAKPAPSVEQTANDYVIPVSGGALDKWRDDREGFREHAAEVARGLFPTLAPQIDRGQTVANLLDPYVQTAKAVLGPDTEPNWGDPKWTKALDGGLDPQTQRPTILPLSAWRTYLQTEPAFGFDKSGAANDRAQGFEAAMHNAFGGAT